MQKQVDSLEYEENLLFLQDHWKDLRINGNGTGWIVVFSNSSGIRIGEGPTRKDALQVGTTFTRDRLEEIRLLESEIRAMGWLIESARSDVAFFFGKKQDKENEYASIREEDAIKYGRIVQRLQKEVDHLKWGMKV